MKKILFKNFFAFTLFVSICENEVLEVVVTYNLFRLWVKKDQNSLSVFRGLERPWQVEAH